jgi:hypothetical protein
MFESCRAHRSPCESRRETGDGRRTGNVAPVADLPEGLTLGVHRDSSHPVEMWLRRALLTVLTLLAALALLNVFGQVPVTSTASGGGATLQVEAPTSLRGGLFYMGRFAVTATLVLDDGWTDSMHVNTIEPAPVGESSRGGDLALDFGHVPAGDTLVAWLELQVNPTNVGRRSQRVRLFDGEELLAETNRTLTVYP